MGESLYIIVLQSVARMQTQAVLSVALLDCSLRRSEPRDGHSVRRAADVVDAYLVEEPDGIGVAAMLAADAALEVSTPSAAGLHAVLYQLAHTLGVDGLERVGIQDLVSEIVTHEGSHVVAGESEGHLGEVVRTEGEELGGTRHPLAGQSRAGDFDHGSEMIGDGLVGMGLDLALHAVADCFLEAELPRGDGHGHHNLRHGVVALLEEFLNSREDGPVLGLCDKRISHMQTHAAQTHHRVDLAEVLASPLDLVDADSKLIGDLGLLLLGLGHELVERRVEQTEHDGLAVHDAHRALDGSLDERLQLGESRLALLVGGAEYHLAQLGEGNFGVRSVEHVLDTEQADTLGAELHGSLSILGSVGVGAHSETAELVDYAHELDEERVLAGVHGLDLRSIYDSLGTVEREPVSLLVDLSGVAGEVEGLLGEVDLEGVASHDAALAPSARNESGVGGHTTAGGEDAGGSAHALDVLGRSLLTNEDHFLSLLGGGHCVVGSEHHGSHGSSRRCGKSLGDHLRGLLGCDVEHGMQDLVEL